MDNTNKYLPTMVNKLNECDKIMSIMKYTSFLLYINL